MYMIMPSKEGALNRVVDAQNIQYHQAISVVCGGWYLVSRYVDFHKPYHPPYAYAWAGRSMYMIRARVMMLGLNVPVEGF